VLSRRLHYSSADSCSSSGSSEQIACRFSATLDQHDNYCGSHAFCPKPLIKTRALLDKLEILIPIGSEEDACKKSEPPRLIILTVVAFRTRFETWCSACRIKARGVDDFDADHNIKFLA
jgi:hypothetical protein